MEPREFIEKWGCGRKELSDLLGVSLGTVEHWFSDRNPPASIKAHLDTYDRILESWQQQRSAFPILSQIFDKVSSKDS